MGVLLAVIVVVAVLLTNSDPRWRRLSSEEDEGPTVDNAGMGLPQTEMGVFGGVMIPFGKPARLEPLSEETVEDRARSLVDPVMSKQDSAVTVEDPDAVFGEFCSTCHVLPPSDVEPKEMWPRKVREMYTYAQGPRAVSPHTIPPIDAAIAYWTSLAPESLSMPPGATGSPAPGRTFKRRLIRLDAIPSPPAISSVQFVRLSDDAPTQLLISDAGNGLVVLWTPSDSEKPVRVMARIAHPCRTHVVDLDGDGLRDVLVANLGDFFPVDSNKGSVVWLRNRGGGEFDHVVLIGGIGRINEIQTADFDSDGDLDLVVAVFGNLTSGMVLYMENLTEDYSDPYFEPVPLDYRQGTSDVPVLDLNGDDHPDFVALQSQENDHVIAFLNRGWGTFATETVYKAPHPRWGSTGIRLSDLDGDGDTDLLFNHGDCFEYPPILRPYHGVGWLENRGGFPFTYHRLARLPGASTSLPGDLDGDGDVDVVSSSFIPCYNPEEEPNCPDLDTVVWLEQTSPGEFERHSLERCIPCHPCGDLGDFDDDGDIDIVLGNFVIFRFQDFPYHAPITVLENQSVSPDAVLSR